MMNSINRHMVVLGRLFLLMFFVANSGFTVALDFCTMGDMSCCSKPEHHKADACNMMDAPQASGDQVISSDNSCHVITVARVLKTDPTVIHNDFYSRLAKVDLIAAIVPHFAVSPVMGLSPWLSPGKSSSNPPPAVETYVLNASFLI